MFFSFCHKDAKAHDLEVFLCNRLSFSPDSSGNPFVPVFGAKDWERIAGIASKKSTND